MDHRDALYLCRLLRSYGERPCSRSTKCRDEIAPSHLTRLRRCPTHCPNYSNLERSARDKWHLPVQDAGQGSRLLPTQPGSITTVFEGRGHFRITPDSGHWAKQAGPPNCHDGFALLFEHVPAREGQNVRGEPRIRDRPCAAAKCYESRGLAAIRQSAAGRYKPLFLGAERSV